MIAIGSDDEAGQPGDMQKGQHVTVGEGGNQHLLGINRRRYRPFTDNVGRGGCGDNGPAVKADGMAAAVAAVRKILIVFQSPADVRRISRHRFLTLRPELAPQRYAGLDSVRQCRQRIREQKRSDQFYCFF
jgi:hypothetical protein